MVYWYKVGTFTCSWGQRSQVKIKGPVRSISKIVWKCKFWLICELEDQLQPCDPNRCEIKVRCQFASSTISEGRRQQTTAVQGTWCIFKKIIMIIVIYYFYYYYLYYCYYYVSEKHFLVLCSKWWNKKGMIWQEQWINISSCHSQTDIKPFFKPGLYLKSQTFFATKFKPHSLFTVMCNCTSGNC